MIRTKAVYRDGTLTPTDPIDLPEGATVLINVYESAVPCPPKIQEEGNWVEEFVKFKEKLYANYTDAQIREDEEFLQKFEDDKSRRREALAEAYGPG